jgi:IclR family acetate operon transcriptional repressor
LVCIVRQAHGEATHFVHPSAQSLHRTGTRTIPEIVRSARPVPEGRRTHLMHSTRISAFNPANPHLLDAPIAPLVGETRPTAACGLLVSATQKTRGAPPVYNGIASLHHRCNHTVDVMIESVARALQILESLSDLPRGATLGMLIDTTGIEKSSVSRVLSTLEEVGYVVRDPTGDVFRVTLRFAAMALRQIERAGLLEACTPALQHLADETGELVQLAVVTDDRPLYVAKAVGGHRIQAQPLIGTAAVLHASAAGKLYLASLNEERALQLALGDGLRKITRQTITTASALQKALRRIREQGFATIEGELSEDLNAIAVPVIHSTSGQMIAAIVVTGPAYRLSPRELVRLVKPAAASAEALREVLTVYARPPGADPA